MSKMGLSADLSVQTTTVKSNIYNTATSNCNVDTSLNADGNIIIIEGSSIGGNVYGVGGGGLTSLDGSCSMMTSNVTNVKDLNSNVNTDKQQAKGVSILDQPEISGGVSVATTNINNQVYNTSSNLCTMNTAVNKNNNLVVVRNDNIKGSFYGVATATDTKSSCNMTLQATANLTNTTLNSNSFTQKQIGVFAVMFGALVLVVVVIVVGGILTAALGLKHTLHSKQNAGAASAPPAANLQA